MFTGMINQLLTQVIALLVFYRFHCPIFFPKQKQPLAMAVLLT